MASFSDSLEREHGHEIVERTASFILSGRYGGLTEEEILDLLAFDEEYWNGFVERSRPAHRAELEAARRIPIAVWS